ncbi:hypothetical protein BH11BAC2_BH11BAC2_02270 [soil metagenome]
MIKQIDQVLRYLLYYVQAENRHDLQAPFIYHLNEAVFRTDSSDHICDAIELHRKELLRNDKIIRVRDFGAGFSGVKYNERKVSYIVANSSKPPRYARLLYRLVKYLHPEYLLELGTSAGISALYQAAANPQGKLITLEGCENTAALAQYSFNKFPDLSIELIQGSFDETLKPALEMLPRLDYLFIDGNHRLEPTLNYFNECLSKMHDHSVIIIDDINWSKEMREAWTQIKAHPRVTISIDLFMLGIVFINPGFSKQEFSIRY